MLWCVIASLFILTSYVASVCARWGVPGSISQTFFSIRHKWIFSACVASSAALLYFPMMDVLAESWQWLAFIFLAGCLFIAFAPNLNDELERNAHMVGAITMGLASQIIVIVVGLYPMLMMWSMGLYMMWQYKDKKVFIAEMIGGACLYLALAIRLYIGF